MLWARANKPVSQNKHEEVQILGKNLNRTDGIAYTQKLSKKRRIVYIFINTQQKKQHLYYDPVKAKQLRTEHPITSTGFEGKSSIERSLLLFLSMS